MASGTHAALGGHSHRPTPRPPSDVKVESGVEEVAAAVAEAERTSRSPLAVAVALAVLSLFSGGAVGIKGWNASASAERQSASAERQYEDLSKKVDILTTEFGETRKAMEAFRTAAEVQAARSQELRYDQRIRELEKLAQESALEHVQFKGEIEALKSKERK